MSRLDAIRRLSACAAALALLAGCGTARALDHLPGHIVTGRPVVGHVAGRFLIWGGTLKQSQSGPRPIRGVVTFTAEGHQRVKVRVGPSGAFTASLPPGRYQVSGRSPSVMTVSNGAVVGVHGLISGSEWETPCSQPLSVSVTAHRTVRATIICYVP
jgi:hypothetical protein